MGQHTIASMTLIIGIKAVTNKKGNSLLDSNGKACFYLHRVILKYFWKLIDGESQHATLSACKYIMILNYNTWRFQQLRLCIHFCPLFIEDCVCFFKEKNKSSRLIAPKQGFVNNSIFLHSVNMPVRGSNKTLYMFVVCGLWNMYLLSHHHICTFDRLLFIDFLFK